MTDPFKMRYLYGKGTITKILIKSNRISEHSVFNSSVTKSMLEFDGRSSEEPQKYKRPEQTINHVSMY